MLKKMIQRHSSNANYKSMKLFISIAQVRIHLSSLKEKKNLTFHLITPGPENVSNFLTHTKKTDLLDSCGEIGSNRNRILFRISPRTR